MTRLLALLLVGLPLVGCASEPLDAEVLDGELSATTKLACERAPESKSGTVEGDFFVKDLGAVRDAKEVPEVLRAALVLMNHGLPIHKYRVEGRVGAFDEPATSRSGFYYGAVAATELGSYVHSADTSAKGGGLSVKGGLFTEKGERNAIEFSVEGKAKKVDTVPLACDGTLPSEAAFREIDTKKEAGYRVRCSIRKEGAEPFSFIVATEHRGAGRSRTVPGIYEESLKESLLDTDVPRLEALQGAEIEREGDGFQLVSPEVSLSFSLDPRAATKGLLTFHAPGKRVWTEQTLCYTYALQ